jgi:hypothetical protein
VIAWLATIRSPISSIFGISSDYVRWLWPASIFLWFAVALTIWRLASIHMPVAVPPRARYVGAIAAIAVVILANVPAHTSLGSQRELGQRRPVAEELVDTASSRVRETVLYRPPPGYDVFGVPLLARLQDRGVDFVVDDPVLVRQFGEQRRYTGDPITELHVVTGLEAIDAAQDPNTIALVSDLSSDERSELLDATIAIESWLFDGRISLSDAGVAAVNAGFGDPWLSQLGDPNIDATTVSRSVSLAAAVESGLLDGDPEIVTELRRFAKLRQSVETSTVAAVLLPADQQSTAESIGGQSPDADIELQQSAGIRLTLELFGRQAMARCGDVHRAEIGATERGARRVGQR